PRDEFIEIYNNTNSPIVVQASDASGGWALSMSGLFNQTTIRGNVCTIPNGTVIPARGHLLCANPDPETDQGYSLNNYPSGNPTPTPTPTPTPGPPIVGPVPGVVVVVNPFATARPDRALLINDPPDGFGIALFKSQNLPNQRMANRLDAFGFPSSPTLYKEGKGFPTVPAIGNEHTLFRDLRSSLPRDANDNAADFRFVATTATLQNQLNGSPGPENLASPVVNNSITANLLDPSVSAASPPNRERIQTPETNAPLGTLIIRRTFTNTTGQPVSRLRFRVTNITTRGTPAGECGVPCADVRALTSSDGTATMANQTVVVVRGVRLEENPPLTPEGGGLNSSLSADHITFGTPLQNGLSVNIQFKLGIVTSGYLRFFVNIEAQNSPITNTTGPLRTTASTKR
ncbi:MAG: lamin tail domain-containing protein, partial [Acidobacteriota bacterium]|nr:lamin tail domain-containing protein [Acidobacteriota bacterium]